MPTPSVPLSAPRPSSGSARAGAASARATASPIAKARTKRMRQRSVALCFRANRRPPPGASRLEQTGELVAADAEQARRGRLVALAALEDRARVAPFGLRKLEVVRQANAVIVAIGRA